MTIDVTIIGAGIIGLATARELLARHPGMSVVVVDKEQRIASHQTGRNSGVIHSGIYYRPGSAKARLCRDGRARLLEFCADHGVAHELCGKVIVAVDDAERAPLAELARRAEANGVTAELVGPDRLAELEPQVRGVEAIHVADTGIVDFVGMCEAMAAEITASGTADLRLGWPVLDMVEQSDGVDVAGPDGMVTSRWVVNCAGLQSDRIARLTDPAFDVRIMPFRGEYYELTEQSRHLVRDLIYPVPDPRFPFLGVHFTRMIDGNVHAGPNAVPALAREGYRWRDVDGSDVKEILGSSSTWTLARRYWRTELGEIRRSLNKKAFVRALQRLLPAVTADDLVPSAAGVRAQAIGPDGALLDDFVFSESARAVHVVNAPSPAATASLAIGASIVDRLDAKLALA